MTKLKGLLYLEKIGLPTPQLIDYDEIINDTPKIKEGLSLRLSSKSTNLPDVYLPSIHNCTEKQDIIDFYKLNNTKYDIIIHKTVHPNIIGSVSKWYIGGCYKIIIETYKNFEDREKAIIEHREIYTTFNEKSWYTDQTSPQFLKLVNLLNRIPFKTFDVEFVVEKNQYIFTDFYTKDSTFLIL